MNWIDCNVELPPLRMNVIAFGTPFEANKEVVTLAHRSAAGHNGWVWKISGIGNCIRQNSFKCWMQLPKPPEL